MTLKYRPKTNPTDTGGGGGSRFYSRWTRGASPYLKKKLEDLKKKAQEGEEDETPEDK